VDQVTYDSPEKRSASRLDSLLAVCGLYCGACYHYRSGQPDGSHLLDKAQRSDRGVGDYTCSGCRSEHLYMHPGCTQCGLRACAESRGLDHCGLCSEAPCEALLAFRNDGRLHHLEALSNLDKLTHQGPALWLAHQATRWRCTCGQPYSWYEETCPRCDTPLDSYGPDPIHR
jgi:hypothetical protein